MAVSGLLSGLVRAGRYTGGSDRGPPQPPPHLRRARLRLSPCSLLPAPVPEALTPLEEPLSGCFTGSLASTRLGLRASLIQGDRGTAQLTSSFPKPLPVGLPLALSCHGSSRSFRPGQDGLQLPSVLPDSVTAGRFPVWQSAEAVGRRERVDMRRDKARSLHTRENPLEERPLEDRRAVLCEARGTSGAAAAPDTGCEAVLTVCPASAQCAWSRSGWDKPLGPGPATAV